MAQDSAQPGNGGPDKSAAFRLIVGGVDSFVRVGRRSVSLGAGADVLNWDRAGRPFAGSFGGFTWHRALDGRMVHIVTSADGRRGQWLTAEDTRQWTETLRRRAEAVCAAAAGAHDSVRQAFAPAATFDGAAWEQDAAAFAQIYQPVRIVPPDHYMALVLQATVGCSWNRCAFCERRADRRYAVRPPEEFRAHAQAVRGFFGAGLAARPHIFIADANAIATPVGRVADWLSVIRDVFPVASGDGLSRAPGENDPRGGFSGIHAFVDAAGGFDHRPEDWALLAEAGLTQVCLGIETGHDALLRILGKPGSAAAAREMAVSVKRAGLAVALVFLAGVGGGVMAEDHERESAALADSLALSQRDQIYIATYGDRPGAEYRRAEGEAGLAPMSDDEAWEQAARMRRAMTCVGRPGGPRAAIYDIGLFAY